MTIPPRTAIRLVVGDDAGAGSASDVAHALGEEVAQRFGPREERPLTIFACDDADATRGCATVGGLNGVSHWNWLYVRNLWVAPHWRGGGLGRSLIAEAERAAAARGCVGVYLDTFSPEAERFYQACGFTTIGRIENFPPGHARRYLVKTL